MKRLLFLFLLMLCLMCTSAALAAEIWVNPRAEDACDTITEAVALAQDGDTIVISGGAYTHETESFPLELTKKLEIRAAAGEDVLIKGAPFQTVFRVKAEGVVLQGLDVEFLRYGVLCLADGLTVEDCSFTLYDTTYRVSSCGVWLAGAKHCRVADCEFIRCGLSMAGPPISESTGSKPVLTALFEIGEDKEYFTSHTVENNLVNGRPLYYFACEENVLAPKDAGGLIAVDCGEVIIDGLNIAESSMGIIAAHCDRVEMTNTTADACGLFGVYLTYIGGGRLENVVVTNTNHGIDLRVVQSLEVNNCHAYSCDQGIFLSWAEECLVTDCTSNGCKAGYFMACGNHNLIVNSGAEDNENALDVENEQNLQVIGNSFRGNKVASIRLNNVTGVVAGNRFEENWVGVISYGRAAQNIYGNHFSGTGSCDLYMLNPSESIIAANTMENSQKVSVQIEGEAKNLVFAGNAYDGTWVDNSVEAE